MLSGVRAPSPATREPEGHSATREYSISSDELAPKPIGTKFRDLVVHPWLWRHPERRHPLITWPGKNT